MSCAAAGESSELQSVILISGFTELHWELRLRDNFCNYHDIIHDFSIFNNNLSQGCFLAY